MSTKKQKLIKWKILCPQIEHYRAVLSDLQRQRNVYSFKINEIDQAIAFIASAHS